MSKRVILDQNGLKVSAPGQDADTALPYQLQFDSDFCAPGLVKRGTRYLSSADFRYKTITVPYGRSFAVPPMVLLGAYNTHIQGSNSWSGVNWVPGLAGAMFKSQVYKPSGSLYTTKAYGQVVITPRNDHLEFKTWAFEDGYEVKPVTIHYAVMSYTL
ncbi:hypothetical protein [Maritalea myrionectae]|uniref:hypothetical protein n=1 Tax=Maritalea myrionectae TaxID=454601 RepID=UPI0003F8E217|nr:hypothetical protein [Maritalea myrionectae]